MTPATLTSTSIDGHPEARKLVVDCEHGATLLMIFPPPNEPEAIDRLTADGARLAVLKHWTEERCSCTAELRRRFGLVGEGAA